MNVYYSSLAQKIQYKKSRITQNAITKSDPGLSKAAARSSILHTRRCPSQQQAARNVDFSCAPLLANAQPWGCEKGVSLPLLSEAPAAS